MRLEDKELEGPELERDERVGLREQRETVEADHELDGMPKPELVDLELAHPSRLLDALQMILDGEYLEVELLYLPQRETRALESLQMAVTGRDPGMGTFVFADDRAELLEQALAVLQQNLTHGSPAALAELETHYAKLTDRVAELRERLVDLEDAQDELMEHQADREVATAPTDTDDRDADSKPGFVGEAVEELGSTLTGPERPEPAKTPSTLVGPAASQSSEPAPFSSTLGDGLDEEAIRASGAHARAVSDEERAERDARQARGEPRIPDSKASKR